MPVEKLQALKSGKAEPIWYNKRYAYFFFIAMFAFLAGCDDIMPPESYLLGIRTFKMPVGSMEPTLRVGDHFIARLQPYQSEKPRRGDIVIFPYPEDRSKTFVKRLIGFGGEKLEIQNKQVFIDGKPIEEPYKQHTDSRVFPKHIAPRDSFGPITIPEGSVFVIGDNRDFSHDSRFFGSVPAADLKGKALYIYWANDLSRIGTRLQ